MLRLAFLGDHFQDQLDQVPPDVVDGLDIVWTGGNRTRFVADGLRHEPQVLVVDASILDPDDLAADLDRLTRAADPELVLLVYSYLRREDVASIQDARTRAIQGPVPLATLRSQMLSLIVREMLRQSSTTARPRTCPACGQPVRGSSVDSSRSAST